MLNKKEYSLKNIQHRIWIKKIEDKFEQDCEAKELKIYPWFSDVARDTLKALIAEMKTERRTKLAEANKTYEAPSDPGVGILVYI